MGRPTKATAPPPVQIPVQGYTRWHNGRKEVVGPYVRKGMPGAVDPDPTLWHDPFPPASNHAIGGGQSSNPTLALAPAPAQWTGPGARRADATFQRVSFWGDIPCQGFSAGCSNAGTYGNTAMYRAFNRLVCLDCAIKMFCLENMTAKERIDYLAPYLIEGCK